MASFDSELIHSLCDGENHFDDLILFPSLGYCEPRWVAFLEGIDLSLPHFCIYYGSVEWVECIRESVCPFSSFDLSSLVVF